MQSWTGLIGSGPMAGVSFTHPVNELITTATVATINGVVPDTVRVWKRAGKIVPAFETPKGQCLYTRSAAERIRDERLEQKAIAK